MSSSPKYCSPEKTTLSVAKRILDFNNGNFTIIDSAGNSLFKLDQKKVHFRERTVLRDAGDSPVVSIQKISLHDIYQVYQGESNEELFTIKDKHTKDGNEETFCVPLTGASEPDFEVKGDFVRRNYQILYHDSLVVAEVAKKHFSISSMITGKNKYGVHVSPSVDQALLLLWLLSWRPSTWGQREERLQELLCSD